MKQWVLLIVCMVVMVSTTVYAIFYDKEEVQPNIPPQAEFLKNIKNGKYDYIQHDLYTTDTVVINTTYHKWYMVGGKELIHHEGCRNPRHIKNN